MRGMWGIVIGALLCALTGAARGDDLAAGSFSRAESPELSAQWQAVQRTIVADAARLASCRAEPWMCAEAELRLEAIAAAGRARDGRARIGEINRAVNLAIRPVSDQRRFGVADRWSGPLETIGTGEGDCEDYAIVKLLALEEAGIARDDLKLVIVHDRTTHSDHAVAAARLEGRWLLLDNRFLALVDLEQTRYLILAHLAPDTEGPRYAAADAESRPDVM